MNPSLWVGETGTEAPSNRILRWFWTDWRTMALGTSRSLTARALIAPPPKPDGPAPHTRCPPPGGKKCAASGKTCTWGFNPSSCYYGKVRKAILKTVKDNPSWFKRDDTLKCDVVLPGFKTSYVSTTVKNIQGLGLCARVDPKDDVELQVKDNATYSEQFRIYSSAKCVRNGGGIYNGRNVPSCW